MAENVVLDHEDVALLRAENKALKEQNRKLEQQVSILAEALRLARHKQFGASSEKRDEEIIGQISFLFNEAEVFVAQAATEEGTPVASHVRHKKHEYTLDNLPETIPTEVVEHRLEGEDLVCPECGETMTDIGVEVVRKLKLAPIQFTVEEHRYHTYACQNCNKENTETPIAKAPKEKSIIPGSFATAEAIAHFMVQKFVMGSPIYRQEQELKRQGIQLSRQTISNWVLRATQDYLNPVYNLLHRELVKKDVLHADETTLQVLHEPGKAPQSKSYLWVYRTGRDDEKPIVVCEYQAGRGAKHPKEFLNGFHGYLHTDGYAGYHNLQEEITVVGCWAHARRKFDEALKALPKGKAKGSSAAQGLAYCDKLFDIEKTIADLSPEERYKQRLEQAKPALDAMLAWANTRTVAPKSALGKAFTYLREQWPYLVNYLKDGRLEISNNSAERTVKPFVIDRKNFLFANTPKGANGSAVMYSMIQTALENDLDPYRYLTWLMRTASQLDLTDEDAVAALVPWNAPDTCKVK